MASRPIQLFTQAAGGIRVNAIALIMSTRAFDFKNPVGHDQVKIAIVVVSPQVPPVESWRP